MLTLPPLVQKYKEKQTVAQVKKVYSELTRAFTYAEMTNGPIKGWFSIDGGRFVNAKEFYDNLKPYLKISKDCGAGEGCFTKGTLKSLSGNNYVEYDKFPLEYRFILADGTAIMFNIEKPNCENSSCGNIKADINGFKGDYTFGKDIFLFDITTAGIKPSGMPEALDGNTFEINCNLSEENRGYYCGTTCAAWVIYNENMDYLHCNDLSWNGKTKCKD